MLPLVILDLDGTVIGSDGLVKQCVWDAADRARAAGVKVAICTGRPSFGTAGRIAERLGPGNPHVFQSGAHVGFTDGRILQVTALREEDVRSLIGVARRDGAVLELYTPTELFVERKTALSERHAKVLGVTAIKRDLESVAANEPVVRAQWVVELGAQEDLLQETPEGVTASTATSPALPGVAFVNLTRLGTSKASATAELARHLRLDLGDVMAVGDSDNDVPMLEVVGHPRVVEGAAASVLERFGAHVPSVEECGAASALDEAVGTPLSPKE